MGVFEDTDIGAIRALEQPWKGERLLQIRTGKVKKVFNLMPSAIFKHTRTGLITVNRLGPEGDEHAYEDHGGPDKALMQYSSQHYFRWKKELPQSEDLFITGGFGENLVASYANERNMCIGDTVQIGTVIAQVTGPRQPCYKLNYRFQVKDIAKRSQDLFRTGWFYRILQEGAIQEGDEMALLERPHPRWSVAKVQYYLYHDMRNEEAMKQMLELKELGSEPRGVFTNRLKKQFEDQSGRLAGIEMDIWTDYRLVERHRASRRIISLVFESVTPTINPVAVLPGSHVRLRLGGKLIRAYSVVSGHTNRFQLAVALSDTSRGGSSYIHRKLRVGQILQVSKMVSSFPLSPDADNHIFIAGGVGITAFIASAQFCLQSGYPFHLHYLVRQTDDIALREHLQALGLTTCVTIYDKSATLRADTASSVEPPPPVFDATAVLKQAHDRTHIYCCGSGRLQSSVAASAQALGVNSANLHFESFDIPTSGDPFTAELADSCRTVEVGGEQTLLDALRDAGLDIASSCEAGNCGTCRVGIRSGRVEHRGTGLLEEEKGEAMLSCVSRGIGTIVLDL